MGDNRAFLRLLSSVDAIYAGPVPSENITVICEYCGKKFVTAKGNTTGECPSCGAPIQKGPRR